MMMMVYNIGFSFPVMQMEGRPTWLPLPGARSSAEDLDDPQQVQDDEDQYDHEQYVNDVARAWKTLENIRAEVTKQPQYEQDDDDPGKHDVSPFLNATFYYSSYGASPAATPTLRGVLLSATWGRLFRRAVRTHGDPRQLAAAADHERSLRETKRVSATYSRRPFKGVSLPCYGT